MKLIVHFVVIGCLALVVPHWQAIAVAEDFSGTPVTLRVTKDIEFANVDDHPLLCDVYEVEVGNAAVGNAGVAAVADSGARSLRPAVLVIHGGGWAVGDKWSMNRFARAFAEQGMVAVSINYRHAPAHKFPAQVDDVRAALVWLNENAGKYSIDTDRIGLFGYSAGAHLSCMIGTLVDAEWSDIRPTTEWEQADGRWKKLPNVIGIVGGGAPCDFRELPIDNTAVAYFLGGSRRERPEAYRAASPAQHASPGDVPTLFIHGSTDLIVPIASSRILFEAQQRLGVPSRFLALDGPGHMLTFIDPQTKTAAVEYLLERFKLR